MKFIIGTQNKDKVAAAKEVLLQILGSSDFTIRGLDVPSGFGETPTNEETKIGAQNRAKRLREFSKVGYAVGIESGLAERYGNIYEEAWCCIISSSGQWYGYSSGLKVPDVLIDKMRLENLQHFEALRTEEIKALLPIKDKKDTWANYSAHMLARRISFEESLRNTLVQVFAPEESLFRK